MKKYANLFMAIMVTWIVSCTADNDNYYRTTPRELKKALQECREANGNLPCKNLEKIAARIDGLTYKLRTQPQEFGIKILKIQMAIAELETAIKNDSDNNDLKIMLAKNKLALKERWALLAWLEAPDSG